MTTRTAWALGGAMVCALAAALTWALAFRTGLGQSADAHLLSGLERLQLTRAAPLAQHVGALCNPGPYALLATAVVGAALVVRGLPTALVVTAVVVVPNVVTQLLKRALAEDRGATVDPVSWPSGHSTAAMALAVAAVIVAGGAWRPAVAVAGGLFAAAVAGSVVVLGWHFPSDAVGGVAIAAAGGCLAAAALSRRAATTAPRSRWPRARG